MMGKGKKVLITMLVFVVLALGSVAANFYFGNDLRTQLWIQGCLAALTVAVAAMIK